MTAGHRAGVATTGGRDLARRSAGYRGAAC